MTYNIYVANPTISEVVRLVREVDADVVCLQETILQSQSELRRELSGKYPHMAFHIGKVGNGPGVLSKQPFRRSRYVSSAHGFNGYWIGEFSLGGRSVQIVNVHLHPTTVVNRGLRALWRGWRSSEATRGLEVQQLVPLLAPQLPTIMLGDFNSLPGTATYERVIGYGFVDCFSEGHAPSGATPTFNGNIRGIPLPVRVDYVFRRGELRAIQSRVLSEGSSDHYPVVTTFGW